MGKSGVIVEADNQKWVQVEGELWQFEADQPLHNGDPVVVKDIRGLVLQVERKD